jgi:hypothetical protein
MAAGLLRTEARSKSSVSEWDVACAEHVGGNLLDPHIHQGLCRSHASHDCTAAQTEEGSNSTGKAHEDEYASEVAVSGQGSQVASGCVGMLHAITRASLEGNCVERTASRHPTEIRPPGSRKLLVGPAAEARICLYGKQWPK